jgi:hypothetical protein
LIADGHAKSFSIYRRHGGGFGLTPLYDVLSSWPVVGKRADQLDIHELKLAMALRLVFPAETARFLVVLTRETENPRGHSGTELTSLIGHIAVTRHSQYFAAQKDS